MIENKKASSGQGDFITNFRNCCYVIKSPCPEEAFLFSISLLRMPIYSIIRVKYS